MAEIDNYADGLKSAENALRDFIEEVLSENIGENWIDQCGVPLGRIEKWKKGREAERRRITSRGIEERLLYYADFSDLSVILNHHWTLFEPCFGDWKTIELYMRKLKAYRNPDAHRREILPFEKHLIIGISGEIRTAITNFRSKKAPTDEYFPHIEYVQDSFGNVVHGGGGCDTDRFLQPGDEVLFTVKAWDPEGEVLEYRLIVPPDWGDWTTEAVLTWKVAEKHISKRAQVELRMRAQREYHAQQEYDDLAVFTYIVLPRR